jgi:hypothetical protein
MIKTPHSLDKYNSLASSWFNLKRRMPEPSHLPAELFAMVIDYVTDGKSDFAALCNISLVSR